MDLTPGACGRDSRAMREETILGCVLAGGQARRFGSDKALAELHGRTLLSLAVDRLAGWCDHVVVVGRETAPAPTLPDWPRPCMGPLGGIAAALRLAADEGYALVLTIGVDAPQLPDDLPALLLPAPACLAAQPVIGLWPASAGPVIEDILSREGRHSLRQFAGAVGARLIELGSEPANVNTPADLAALSKDDQNR